MTSPTASTRPAVSHVAFACQDLQATHHFYSDILGLRLAHTELSVFDEGWFKHVFYDLGDGSAIAFFDLHGVGETQPMQTAISTDLGLPVWANHVALRADQEWVDQVTQRLADEGQKPWGTIDHGWVVSTYYLDPNGILVELAIDSPGMPDEPDEALRQLTVVPEAGA